MYKCRNCGAEFSSPEKKCETHGFNAAPFEVFYICPRCKSENFAEKTVSHCRCCGARLPENITEYCSDACRRKGKQLWEKEAKRRKEMMRNPISLMVKETLDYNLLHGTNYSYGQYVAIIRPKILLSRGENK